MLIIPSQCCSRSQQPLLSVNVDEGGGGGEGGTLSVNVDALLPLPLPSSFEGAFIFLQALILLRKSAVFCL